MYISEIAYRLYALEKDKISKNSYHMDVVSVWMQKSN